VKRFLALLALLAAPTVARAPVTYPVVRPGPALAFPRDHGAHARFRTEWWYVTGALRDDAGRPLGFQVTFFQSRLPIADANPSRFAPRHAIAAHAALSDVRAGRLHHAQNVFRAGLGIAGARQGDADVRMRDWRLWRGADGLWRARAGGDDFALELTFRPTQPPLLQGQAGYSRKGPDPEAASYYYSLPQLAVTGRVRRGVQWSNVTGRAWLDREWSSTLLDARAAGWDWAGINLDGGGALTAFQVRGRDGRAQWAGGSYRAPDGGQITFAPGDVRFEPLRRWRSPRSGATYPIAQAVTVRLPGGPRRFVLTPAFPDQELDGRASGTAVYWEGLVGVSGAGRGQGYLEMTGYAAPFADARP